MYCAATIRISRTLNRLLACFRNFVEDTADQIIVYGDNDDDDDDIYIMMKCVSVCHEK